MTIDELNALPAGTHVSDSLGRSIPGEPAHWVKHEGNSWHLIEQVGSVGWVGAGYDWSPAEGDTAETVAGGVDLQLESS